MTQLFGKHIKGEEVIVIVSLLLRKSRSDQLTVGTQLSWKILCVKTGRTQTVSLEAGAKMLLNNSKMG